MIKLKVETLLETNEVMSKNNTSTNIVQGLSLFYNEIFI